MRAADESNAPILPEAGEAQKTQKIDKMPYASKSEHLEDAQRPILFVLGRSKGYWWSGLTSQATARGQS